MNKTLKPKKIACSELSSNLDQEIYKILSKNRVFTQTLVTPVNETAESVKSSSVSVLLMEGPQEIATPYAFYDKRFPSSLASTMKGQSNTKEKEQQASFDIISQINAMRRIAEKNNADLDLDKSLDDLTEDKDEYI